MNDIEPPPENLKFSNLKIGAQLKILDATPSDSKKAQFLIEVHLTTPELEQYFIENAKGFADLFLLTLQKIVNDVRYEDDPSEGGVW